MNLLTRLSSLLLVVVAVALLTSASSNAASCSAPKYPGLGYFTSLTVTHTSCATGKKVTLAYYKCRVKHGGKKGHCPGGVLSFKCKEGSRHAIPTEYNARVTCTKGKQKVVHTYQQDT
jgi:hypothetical protein